MQVAISKALILKKRLIGRLALLDGKIANNNSMTEGKPREIDVRAALEQREKLMRRLLDWKLKLYEASGPIRETIFRLSEAKGEVMFWLSLNCTEGKEAKQFGEGDIIRTAVVSADEAAKKAEDLENEIDQLQSKLEMFNQITTVNLAD